MTDRDSASDPASAGSDDRADRDRALIQQLLEGSPSGALLLDCEFRVVWLNAAMERVLGVSREVLLAPGKRDQVRELLTHVLEDGEARSTALLEGYRRGAPPNDVECHVLAENGRSEFWLARHSRVLAGSGGGSGERWVEFYVDVTSAKRAEEAAQQLAISSEEQAFILGNMNGFTYRHDKAGLFHYMSPSVRRITGYRVDEWMNHYTTYLTDNPVNDRAVERTESTLRTGETNEPYIVEITHKRGSRVLLEVAERAYFEEGEVAGIVGVALDVTERERAERQRRSLEDQLRYAQKLESLGMLAGGIAHDFNNLLMAILGNASLARDELPADSPQRENLQEIADASQRAADLCGQMLAYAGRAAVTTRAVDLSTLLDELDAMINASIPKKARLVRELARDLPPVVGDPTQIQQVALNLITNAAESIGDNAGEIDVRTGVGEFELEQLREFVGVPEPRPGTYAWIEVTDTGCGMRPEMVERVFDPFFTTKFAGRGLGLSTVLGILRGHGGALELESVVGRGTRFRALFPAGVEHRQRRTRPSGAAPAKDGVVLLVDDELAVRRVTSNMLEKLGFEVLVAANGRQALEVFKEHRARIDCVLLDVTMPEMGGDECLLELRAIDPELPAILASGYDEAEATRKLDSSVAYGFLCKPFTREALAAQLREVTGG